MAVAGFAGITVQLSLTEVDVLLAALGVANVWADRERLNQFREGGEDAYDRELEHARQVLLGAMRRELPSFTLVPFCPERSA